MLTAEDTCPRLRAGILRSDTAASTECVAPAGEAGEARWPRSHGCVPRRRRRPPYAEGRGLAQ
eukprot:1217780-Alexandrium_andersonii.AAC.1